MLGSHRPQQSQTAPARAQQTRRAARRVVLAGLVAAALAVPVGLPLAGPGAAPADAASARQIDFEQFRGTPGFSRGTASGTTVRSARLVLSDTARTASYGGASWRTGTWTSPWTYPGFSLTELVASWNARTPGRSLIQLEVRGADADGRVSSWDSLARWAEGDTTTKRTSSDAQADDLASVAVDTWRTTSSTGLRRWQLRVTLRQRTGTSGSGPAVTSLGAMSSRLPSSAPATSAGGPGRGIVLDVPRYSQMVHRGDFPQWGNGGEAWCSPTSTSMVLGYYDALPPASEYAWVRRAKGSDHPEPWVDHAARKTYDERYGGTGNWPFNTAYAGTRTYDAFVTRLRSLGEAEKFIAAGIPLVASVTFGKGDLDGAPISSTNGHLLVIVGFTSGGDVVVNDPAASTNAGVRRTYDRAQFEKVWLPRSGGLVYVIRDAEHPLPDRGGRTNW